MSALREDIKRELFLLKPSSLHEAIGMAKLVEDKLATLRIASPRSTNFRQLLPTPSHPATTTRNPTLPIKRVTPTEMAARWEKEEEVQVDGTDEFVQPTPTLIEEPSPSLTIEEHIPAISLHALTG
ncbi:hypothetical protein Tco_1504811 [Tanacetum coccineum]